MGLLEDLDTMLVAAGEDTSDHFNGPFNDTPEKQVARILTQSPTPDLGYCGVQWESPRIAFQVRDSDPKGSRDRTFTLWKRLVGIAAQTVDGSRYLEVVPQSSPFFIDEDPNGLIVHGFTAEVRRIPA